MKELEAQLETLNIQEEYIKDEQKNLKRELLRAQEEVKRIQSVPLVIGQFLEMIDPTTGIVGSTTGMQYSKSNSPSTTHDRATLLHYISVLTHSQDPTTTCAFSAQ